MKSKRPMCFHCGVRAHLDIKTALVVCSTCGQTRQEELAQPSELVADDTGLSLVNPDGGITTLSVF